MKKADFFKYYRDHGNVALSFGDVRILTGYSEVDPISVDVSSRFSRRVPLYSPISSAAMDTVTEHKMAITMARAGGLGVIHRGLNDEMQLNEAIRVKTYLNAVIEKPVYVLSTTTLEEIENMMATKKLNFQSFPVINSDGNVVGVITEDDFLFSQNNSVVAGTVMQKAFAPAGTTVQEAYQIMRKKRIKALPLVNEKGKLVKMYTLSDLNRIMNNKHDRYNVDSSGHLRVGVAIGVGDVVEHAIDLVKIGVDVLVLDTAHGNSLRVYNTLAALKRELANYDVDIVVGNVSEGDAAKRLANAGADGIKVGQGPGSICTTRMIAGIGCPQLTAIYNCASAVEGSGIPIIADGGISHSGDIPIAIAAGADCIMTGMLLAGTDEAPGEVIISNGIKYMSYRGMGSPGAMKNVRVAQRYGATGKDNLVPEGVEARVPYQGSAEVVIKLLEGGLRKGMGYMGVPDIRSLQDDTNFYFVTKSGMEESKPHGVSFQSTSNYSAKEGS